MLVGGASRKNIRQGDGGVSSQREKGKGKVSAHPYIFFLRG